MWTWILKIISDITGIAARRDELKNAPDVKEAQKRQDEVQAQGGETKAVAEKDIESTQRNWSE